MQILHAANMYLPAGRTFIVLNAKTEYVFVVA